MESDTDTTARRIVMGTWICAGIVMATSVGNSVLTFGAIGGNRAIGFGVGAAVDVALYVGLTGDRILAQHGLASTWGRVLRFTAAGMSVVLSTGAALKEGNYFLAVLFAFLPVLLVLLTEYGQDVLLKFTALRKAARPTPADSVPTTPTLPEPIPVVLPDPLPTVPRQATPAFRPAVGHQPTTEAAMVVAEQLPGWASKRPAARDALPTTPPVPHKRRTPRTELTPELLAKVRDWRVKRIQAGLPVGRRPMAEDPELGISDGLARKVLHALAGEIHHLRATGTE